MLLLSRLLPGLLFAAGVASGLSGCGSKSEELPVNTKDLSTGYRTDTVRLRAPEQDLRFTGKVSYDQSRVDRIFPVVSGNVLEVTQRRRARQNHRWRFVSLALGTRRTHAQQRCLAYLV